MRLLDKLSADPIQTYTVVTEAGDQVQFELRYMPTQQSWFASIEWGAFSLKGVSINISPNILFGYKNILPFGFMVTSNNGIEPAFVDDFATGRIKIYVLTPDDIIEQEGIITA